MKQCTKCKIEKDESEFYKSVKHKGGLHSQCKECKKNYFLENKEKIKEYKKNYRIENIEKIKDTRKQYYFKYKEKTLENKKQYYLENKESIKKYRLENKDKLNTSRREYLNKRRKIDINYNIAHNLRSRLNSALKGHCKSKKTLQLLGCSIEEFKTYLASQFYNHPDTGEQMSFENYGSWHLDHIIPCAAFVLENSEEQEVCFHFTNIQPLWAEDNLRKGDKFDF